MPGAQAAEVSCRMIIYWRRNSVRLQAGVMHQAVSQAAIALLQYQSMGLSAVRHCNAGCRNPHSTPLLRKIQGARAERSLSSTI